MTLSTRTLVTVNGQSVWATREQADTLATLEQTRKGGFARIYGYKATSGRVVPTVYDTTVTTRFSYGKLLERKKAAIAALTVADIAQAVKREPKLAALSANALADAFEARKADTLASIDKTESGDRSDSHRQAHDRCYMSIADGVIVHYSTEADANGIKQPVMVDGFPMVDSIMLNVLEVSRNVREAGEYKKVNSGVPVLIGNAIKAALKAAGVRDVARVSLKEGNFERVAIDGEVVLPEDVVALA